MRKVVNNFLYQQGSFVRVLSSFLFKKKEKFFVVENYYWARQPGCILQDFHVKDTLYVTFKSHVEECYNLKTPT